MRHRHIYPERLHCLGVIHVHQLIDGATMHASFAIPARRWSPRSGLCTSGASVPNRQSSWSNVLGDDDASNTSELARYVAQVRGPLDDVSSISAAWISLVLRGSRC
jgi:hypothetical protein